MNRNNHRYHMLVLSGVWAATLQHMGTIELPSGEEGHDVLSRFVKNRVNKYIDKEINVEFNEYIEAALIEKFGTK